ncbi:hypothetical protein P9D47_08895 [Bacillus haynesii]|uniref:hypothetical protein n=1 Tax=Bacillus haynesii TaxID=1925021 RepID=UPI0020CDA56B|nr:hypothetical protein [Bacillus haynesii]MCY7778923.1 hypothetical protein [Bacillus haynesii]MEC0672437.1 hypothetical protein [Bacillus haynesii]MEC1419885.1 hypothetical protein [Bacillus haynesii]MEC1468130.1 hypothetical protein [Bacillus haynesii]
MNRDADYVAPYYFELISHASHPDRLLAHPAYIEPVNCQTNSGSESQTGLIYLSDKAGNPVEITGQEELYISLVNQEAHRLKGYLYYFHNGEYQKFMISRSKAQAFSYQLAPETVQTYPVNLKVLWSNYFRFLSTSIPPDGAYRDAPFPARMISYSKLYT